MTTPEPGDLLVLDRLLPALTGATGDTGWQTATASLIGGGKSNLTFLLSGPAGEVIVRRPPTGELLPSAHDMGREARVQRSLAGSSIPVPEIVMADDGDLIGVPFYVMERVPGHIIRGEMPGGYATTPAERVKMAEVFVDTLADLHAVDYEAVGLADYGRPEGFMTRQVRRWTSQWEASRTGSVPQVDELARLLAEKVPTQRRSSIVHGDYRIDNVVYDTDDPGRINAVLDWELSSLGDPLTDVALVVLFWRNADEPALDLIPGVTHLPGFPDRETLIARYAAASGADVSDLGYYLAFAHFKFAAIAQGVATRSAAGAMGGQDFGDLSEQIAYLGDEGLRLIKEQ